MRNSHSAFRIHNSAFKNLLVYFPHKHLHLRHTALVDEVAVVRLSWGDFTVDGSEHDVLHLFAVVRLAQGPTQLDVGGLGEHVLRGDDATVHQVTASVVDEHVGIAPDGLHGHVLVHALVGGALDGIEHATVDVTQARAVPNDALIAIVDQCIKHIGLHAGIVVKDGHAVVEGRDDLHVAVSAAVVVDFLDRHHTTLAVDGGDGRIADGAECAAVAGVHLTHTRATVQEAVLVGGGTEHADHHLGHVAVTGSGHSVHKVQSSIRRRTVR